MKTQAKHTPGPWETCRNEIDVYAPESDRAITLDVKFKADDSPYEKASKEMEGRGV